MFALCVILLFYHASFHSVNFSSLEDFILSYKVFFFSQRRLTWDQN